MAALINGPRALLALLLILALVLPSLHSVDWTLQGGGGGGSGLCSTLRLPNGRVKLRERGIIAKFQCRLGTILWGPKYATCIQGEWDQKPPICVLGAQNSMTDKECVKAVEDSDLISICTSNFSIGTSVRSLIEPGCRPLSPLPRGSIMVRYQGAVAMLMCQQGYYLVTLTQSSYGISVMNVGDRNTGFAYIYCDGRRWNATGYQCLAIPTTPRPSTTSPTPVTTPEEPTTTTTSLETTLLDLAGTTSIEYFETTTAAPEGDTTPWEGEGNESPGGTTYWPPANTTTPPPRPPSPPPRPPIPRILTNRTTTTTRSSAAPSFTTPSPLPISTRSPTTNGSTSPRQTNTTPSSSAPISTTKSPSSRKPWPLTTPPYISTTPVGATRIPQTWCDFSGRPSTTSVWKRLRNGRLTKVDEQVAPESPTCGWVPPPGSTKIAWERSVGFELGSSVPSFKKPEGSCLRVVMIGNDVATTGKAMVISPTYKMSSFGPEGPPACFSFWYQISHGTLEVAIRGASWVVISSKSDDGPAWKFATVTLKLHADEFQLALIAQPAYHMITMISVDNLWLVNSTMCEIMKASNATGSTNTTTRWKLNPAYTRPTRPGPWANASIATRFPRTTSSPKPSLPWTHPSRRKDTTPTTKASSSPRSTPKSSGGPTLASRSPSTRRPDAGVPTASPRIPVIGSERPRNGTTRVEEESTGVGAGIPRAVIWSAAAVSAVALLVLVGVCARRLANRRKSKLREGGDGDSDVRYLTSDEEHLDFSLQRVACEDM